MERINGTTVWFNAAKGFKEIADLEALATADRASARAMHQAV
jgi:hypothetical protein